MANFGSVRDFIDKLVVDVGGSWVDLDDENAYIERAAERNGVPPNLLKAMLKRESSGNWARDNRIADVGRIEDDYTPDYILPFVGVFESTAKSRGYSFEKLVGNRGGQIDAMAGILRQIYEEQGRSWSAAAGTYFGPPGFTDEFGKKRSDYEAEAIADASFLDNAGIAKSWPDIDWPSPYDVSPFPNKLEEWIVSTGGDIVGEGVEQVTDNVFAPVLNYLTEWAPRVGLMVGGLVALLVAVVVTLR